MFIVKDKPHPLFKREGNDLISKPEIPLVTVSNWIGSRSDLELTNFFVVVAGSDRWLHRDIHIRWKED